MEEMVKRMNLDPTNYIEIYGTPSKNIFPQSKNYGEILLPLMLPDDLVFYSFASTGFTHKFNPTKGPCAYLKSNFNRISGCYKAMIGTEKAGQKFILAQKLKTFNPLSPATFHPMLQPICNILTKWQTFFFQFTEEDTPEYTLIPFVNIISFVLHVEFNNSRMLFDISERYNKT
uniref:Uncharacterized protein n=1 Tax=Panagrolaimus davidi TaxID=227884 RepID=A0A914NZU6_9BILA